MDQFFAGGTCCVVFHLEVYECFISQLVQVFLVETLAWLMVFLPAFAAYKIAAVVAFYKLKHFLYFKACIATVSCTTFAQFYIWIAMCIAAT